METIHAFTARAEQSFRQRLDAKDAELRRAVLALRLEAAKLADAHRRMRAAQRAVDRIRDSYRGKRASQGAAVAILATIRVRRALANPDAEPE